MQFLTIDRFEGDYAICENEDGKLSNIARIDIENNAKEGDTIFRSAGSGVFEVDKVRTQKARKAIEARFQRLTRDKR